MVDRFIKFIHGALEKDSDFWATVAASMSLVEREARSRLGTINKVSFSGSSPDHKDFDRDSFADLKKAFVDSHTEAETLDAYVHMADRTKLAMINLQGRHSHTLQTKAVTIQLQGPDRVAVEAFAHQLKVKLDASQKLKKLAPTTEWKVEKTQVHSKDSGRNDALARPESTQARPGRVKRFLNAPWTVQLLGGVIVAGILFALGWLGTVLVGFLGQFAG